MDPNPFFSVIIPTYERANVIEECVRSILDQSFKNIEVVVVDDGSTDNTGDILKSVAESDDRLRYIYQENAERSNARNHGIMEAKGEYICFLDSDDLFLPDHLSSFYNKLQDLNFPQVMLYCDSKFEGGHEEAKRPLPTPENIMELVLLNPIGAEQACIHKSIMKKHLFDPQIRIGEDRELWFRIAQEHQLMYSDHRTVMIRDLGDRSVDVANTWAYQENITLIDHLKAIDTKGSIPKWIIKRLYSSGYYKLAKCHYLKKERLYALGNLLRSIFIWPTFQYKFKVIFLFNLMGIRFLLPSHVRDEF